MGGDDSTLCLVKMMKPVYMKGLLYAARVAACPSNTDTKAIELKRDFNFTPKALRLQ